MVTTAADGQVRRRIILLATIHEIEHGGPDKNVA